MTAIKEKKTKNTVKYSSDENVLSTYLLEINRIPLLSREEEDSAARAAAQGDRAAREKLVNANLRFVVNVAKKYQGQGMPLSDLISEGNIGLLQAVDRFDSEKGYHFISYAVWWIRQAILKAICEKSRMIRLPLNRVNELIQIEKARKVLQEHNSAEAEIREIAGFLDMDRELVADLIGISRSMVSLENPVYPGQESSPIGDFIEDMQYRAPEEKVVQNALESDIEEVLESLDKKEADIIRFRYGLGNRAPMSLKEIGARFKLTKERIRQIEKKAMLRLKNPVRMQKLEAYVA
ncbi:MAG: RNA polymerase sigma factor RpoD/SigA [Treponema sp.]|jgi:RNA polymerase primary sigma factor|nr:RNA polymerase sigma factor RpoD/SigA [Treponema sp.]